ncbi:DoxX family protein [Pseudonocardia spinosispora]|uniref:DoxX family protein n=1 Tax=Pseudonocardia spinosispora TaxID=103441 RepID=UPI000419A088|nr:DoxX family protein [Pseudonocardia spinosispora]
MTETTATGTTPTPTGQTDQPGKTATRIGWTLSVLMILFLIFDAVPKILKMDFVIEASKGFGITPDTWPVIGTLLLVFTIAYAIPRTSVFGAVLITAHLGGAVCANVLGHSPLVMILFPVFFAVPLWLGLYLRSAALRRLVRVGY